jgi:hypothetical protein
MGVCGLLMAGSLGSVWLNEWARRLLVAMSWLVSLLWAALGVTAVLLPAALGDSYSLPSSRILLTYFALCLPFLAMSLAAWLYFRRDSVSRHFHPASS